MYYTDISIEILQCVFESSCIGTSTVVTNDTNNVQGIAFVGNKQNNQKCCVESKVKAITKV